MKHFSGRPIVSLYLLVQEFIQTEITPHLLILLDEAQQCFSEYYPKIKCVDNDGKKSRKLHGFLDAQCCEKDIEGERSRIEVGSRVKPLRFFFFAFLLSTYFCCCF